ncbi:Low-affinity potassium transport protein [Cladobotryum mycophilum]|uniref:Potassium transport protein n=1 Tax=Cladobotryum mycophilum TaxID=491253 RepID=A0ABR0SEA3_9HYPO
MFDNTRVWCIVDFWILGATITASIAIFIGGKGTLSYIDALMFASGANTQAGLNPVDVNNLNGFQQSMIYLFALLSNPISLHTCVVFLRLYWFEKRFQDWVREARLRRRSISKSKSQARNDPGQVENQIGVNGRRITIMPANGRSQRLTNDGILVDRDHDIPPRPPGSGNESDTTMTDERSRHMELEDIDPLDKPEEKPFGSEVEQDGNAALPEGDENENGENIELSNQGHTAITFADTVMRSDGMGSDATKFPQHRSNAEHIAIVERQRNQDNEVLRIPGPRDAERGLGPRRLEEDDQDEDDHPVARQTTTEPEKHIKEELKDDAKAVAGTLDSLRFRKPRILNRHQDKVHEDNEPKEVRSGRTKTMDTIRSVLSREKTEDMPYLSYTPTMGRNSNFLGLTLEQREELGGIEYRSLRTLALVLLFYFWMFHLLALVCLLPYILHNNRYGSVLDKDKIGRTWWAFWTSNMAFMDVGFSLTPDSMNSFATSEWVLVVMWFFIIIGNTGFPVMLRFLIWVFSKLVPKNSGLWEEFMFLLDHPRRCFTLLFPSNANWWLFWILIMLNIIDLVFFVVLDLGSEPIHNLPLKDRVVVGLFQAASTRTAGFSAASMSDLHPAMPVLYMIMMYISVFPIAISIRRTNVYEEKSLGVYPDKHEDTDDAPALSYVGTHLRRQLSFDLWYVFLGFFLLAITEGGKIQRHEFDLFAVLFEIISAYGTVGLSIGVPNVNASLCSQFSIPGKLIIVAMQIRGRHRGLPYGLDRAVLLPNEARFKKEAEDAEAVFARANPVASTAIASGVQRPTTSSGLSRSKSRERNATNIITQFLHPGPVIHNNIPAPRPRARSVDGHRRTRSAADVSEGPFFTPFRTQTVPHPDNTMERIAPLRSLQLPYNPQRSDSSAF